MWWLTIYLGLRFSNIKLKNFGRTYDEMSRLAFWIAVVYYLLQILIFYDISIRKESKYPFINNQ